MMLPGTFPDRQLLEELARTKIVGFYKGMKAPGMQKKPGMDCADM